MSLCFMCLLNPRVILNIVGSHRPPFDLFCSRGEFIAHMQSNRRILQLRRVRDQVFTTSNRALKCKLCLCVCVCVSSKHNLQQKTNMKRRKFSRFSHDHRAKHCNNNPIIVVMDVQASVRERPKRFVLFCA